MCFWRARLGEPPCLVLPLLLKGTLEEATLPKLPEHGVALAARAGKSVLDSWRWKEEDGIRERERHCHRQDGYFVAPPL